jgi:hydroxymethylpyrimidine/phosphomethylpyrimidine kinase
MAKGFSPEVSVKKAIRFVNISIKNSLDIGRGFGPVNVLIKQEIKDEN